MSDCWSWSNAVDATGTLISSTVGSSGELLPTNLRDPRVGKIWRAGATEATLNIALPDVGAVSIFGLFGLNYAAIGAITLKLGTEPGNGDLWQETFQPSGRQAVFVLRDADGALDPVAAAHATVSVASGAPLEIGRIWLGTADWEPTVGHSVEGSGWQFQDLSRISRTPRTGAVLIDRGNRLRTFTANYDMLSESEYSETLMDMDERGLAQQMLFVPNSLVYSSAKFAVLGYILGEQELPATDWRAFMTAGRSITITEAG